MLFTTHKHLCLTKKAARKSGLAPNRFFTVLSTYGATLIMPNVPARLLFGPAVKNS